MMHSYFYLWQMEILQEKFLLYMFPFSIHFHGDSLLVGAELKVRIHMEYAWELKVLSDPKQHGSRIGNSHDGKVSSVCVCVHIKDFRVIYIYAHNFYSNVSCSIQS